MKRYIIMLVLIIPIILPALRPNPYEMIVKTTKRIEISQNKLQLNEFDNFLSDLGTLSIEPVLRKKDNRYYLIKVSQKINWAEINKKKFPGIEYIQQNNINDMYVIPNDPEFVNQLLENINLPQAWDYTTGNNSIIISIIDSGLHFDHPDLGENVYINTQEIRDNEIDDDGNGFIDDWRGWDFVDAPEFTDDAIGDFLIEDNDPTDEYNHGTHVGGIIAATTNNNEGIAGVNWHCKLLVVRSGFNTLEGGFLQDDDAAAGIIYAADMGADVISLSWGDVVYSPIIAEACQYAYDHGSIVVAAAGNTGSSPLMYPARLSTTISVGAIDKYNQIATFSSFGPSLDVVAPGVGVISTYDVTANSLYKIQSGTSMSAPFVAGSIGLLLSVEPDLTYEEVRSRLVTSAMDLGDSGFDNHYGNGLIDVRRMLTNSSYPVIEITSPQEMEGLHDTFDIIGTVQSDDFDSYSVMYTTKKNPTAVDWYNITDHQNSPYYYHEQVTNDILASFDISGISPVLKEYELRIEVCTKKHQKYDLRRRFLIDQTEPVYIDSLTSVMKRYYDENQVYYTQVVFNEPVYVSLNASFGGNSYAINSIFCDSVQVLELPPSMPEGAYHITYNATNQCGLSSHGEFSDDIRIIYHTVDVNGFSQDIIGDEIITTRKCKDFDGNGKMEFFGYSRTEDGDSLRIFEIDDDRLIVKKDLPFFMHPHDIGNTNEQGVEIVGVSGDVANIYEPPSGNFYPDTPFLFQWNEVNGANLLDYDNDGLDEAVIVQDLTEGNPPVTRRVIKLYERNYLTFNEVTTIYNNTPYYSRNEFNTKVLCGNLNGNGINDLLATDKDGDVMIFEDGVLVWTTRVLTPKAYYIAIGNFTGHEDGLEDFCVGGYVRDPSNTAKTFAFFQFFGWSTEVEQFVYYGYLSLDNIGLKNSIATADFTRDGTDEIVLAFPPNTYIIDYVDTNGNGVKEFAPIWKGEAQETMDNIIAATSGTESQSAFAIVNVNDGGKLKSSIIRNKNQENSLITPGRFFVEPLNATEVQLTWEAVPDVQSYKIYRKHNNHSEMIGETVGNSFIDRELVTGDTLYYQITSYDETSSPNESFPTLWKQVIPLPSPLLLGSEMISNYDIKLLFDSTLGFDALNITNFSLNNDYGYPQAVNFLLSKRGLIVHFAKYLQNPQNNEEFSNYVLTVNSLKGYTGVEFHDPNYLNGLIPITYEIDVTPPRIIKAEKYDRKTAKIFFSEPILAESAENIDNYTLILPESDHTNEIIDLSYNDTGDEFFILMKLKNTPLKSNIQYFLSVKDIYDLAGNKISNDGNKCEFMLNDIAKLDQMIVAPNPFKRGEYPNIRFYLPLGKEGNIYIYDLAGDLIFSDKIDKLNRLTNSYDWDVKNNNHLKVSSGLYIYVIKLGKEVTRGKIAILN